MRRIRVGKALLSPADIRHAVPARLGGYKVMTHRDESFYVNGEDAEALAELIAAGALDGQPEDAA